MKKSAIILIFVALVIAVAWFVWFRSAAPQEEEAKPATEVPVHVGKITRTTLRAPRTRG